MSPVPFLIAILISSNSSLLFTMMASYVKDPSALRGIGAWVQFVDAPQRNASLKELDTEYTEVPKRNRDSSDSKIRAWVSNFDLDFWHEPDNILDDGLDRSHFQNQTSSGVIARASTPSENDTQSTILALNSDYNTPTCRNPLSTDQMGYISAQ
ncbi:hypothetical protein F4815DRAFT_336338 [Daldinia loculata]|uniref:uncharacterized protein n=1 Tax=Daldinia loculata TaxID=103429 RepID=UPI0020C4739F|nr:uncharacterized protein F4817DRAFT_98291 [Daldinia loculata]KAI1647693.1 hypothetical protein F4817DRAFT_98291 [Daldinia loculata]KAI2776693.1 hypothetical protein F4815DRAFT_336338 [Daldinia loculata]